MGKTSHFVADCHVSMPYAAHIVMLIVAKTYADLTFFGANLHEIDGLFDSKVSQILLVLFTGIGILIVGSLR